MTQLSDLEIVVIGGGGGGGSGGVTSVDGRTGAVTLGDLYVDAAGDTLSGSLTFRADQVADPVSLPSLNWNGVAFTGAAVSGASLMGGTGTPTFNFTSGTAGPGVFGLRMIPILGGTVGGSLAAIAGDARANNTGVWAGFGELNPALVGGSFKARTVAPFSGVGDGGTTVAGVHAFAGHNAGTGTIGQLIGVVISAPTYVGGGSVLNGSQGVRVGNQGNAGWTHAYGLRVDAQTGSTTLNVGVRIDAASQRSLWLGADTQPTTPAGGITFGSAGDTVLYRSGVGVLATTALALGTNPASGGDIRLPSAGEIRARNAANTADINMLRTDTSNNTVLVNPTRVMVTIGVTNKVQFDQNQMQLQNGVNIAFFGSTGGRIGVSPAEKFAFWNATPVAQPTGMPAAATDAATTQTLANHLRTLILTLGLSA